MHEVIQDLRFTLRQLRKTPAFTLIAVLTLALGIGATATIFSLVEGVLLRPLPFADSDRLVKVSDRVEAFGMSAVTSREVAVYEQSTRSFSSLGAYTAASYELSSLGTPEQLHGARLTASVFPTLGVPPLLGRTFTEQEENTNQTVAVLSYGTWLTRFHGDPGVLGRTLVLNRNPYVIIGVMPKSFECPLAPGHAGQTEFWVPMSFTSVELSEASRGYWGYQMVGRLKPGVTVAQAEQDTNSVAQQIMRSFPANLSRIRIHGTVTPLREDVTAAARPLIRTLFFAVLFVLLISCVNVAGLLLVRAIRRKREFAVRLALGAQSNALIRQSLVEGLLISLMGGVLGIALASVTLRVSLRLLPESMPRIADISLDTGVVLFSLLLALITGLLCSVAPAFAAIHTDLNASLKEGGRSGTASHGRLRSLLVVIEVAIALMLLTASGALLRSFQKMRQVDPGFRADHVLIASYGLPKTQYPTDATTDAFNKSLLSHLEEVPGVTAAGLTDVLPAAGYAGGAAYTSDNPHTPPDKVTFAAFATISGDFFHTMSIPLLEGRYFNSGDRSDGAMVTIVNESFAKQAWPGEHALGKRMHIGNPKKNLPWATVVGVVGDTKLNALDQPSSSEFYVSAQQYTALLGQQDAATRTAPAGGYITLRSSLPPDQMEGILRSTVASIDPLLSLQHVQPMEATLSASEAPRRFNTALISLFAMAALVMSIIGLAAVVTFSVSLRTQEMAIRMALGSSKVRIIGLVLASGARMTLLGCAIGLLGSFAVSRLLGTMLFGVTATDPLVLAGSSLCMLAMALLASMLPAARAASVNPVTALRSE